MNTKYNYCVFGGGKFFEVAYADLMSQPDIIYYKDAIEAIKSRFFRLVYRATFSPTVNRFWHFPFKGITFRELARCDFANNKPICFIFFSNHYKLIDNGFITFLRKCYTDCKVVLYLQDLVRININLDINFLRNNMDLILSYDKGDCDKYGLVYHPTPYSKIDIKAPDIVPDSDVFFCGKAKTRFKTIYSVYKALTEHRLKCCFIVIGVPENERVQGEGLIYSDGISYKDNIRYELKTRCILEIMQDGATGFTPRLWEAIMYDKHILTNNDAVFDSEYYKKGCCHSIEEIETVNEWIYNEAVYTQEQKKSLSPFFLIEKIENHLLSGN